MPTRDVDQIMAEWRELEREQQRLCDDGVPAALDDRIREVRLEYLAATAAPDDAASAAAGPVVVAARRD